MPALPASATLGEALVDQIVSDGQSSLLTVGIAFAFDGGGSAIADGKKVMLTIPFACTITAWHLIGDVSGSITVDVWKSTHAAHPPTNSNSITASATPALSSADSGTSSTLTGWTTSIAAGDTLIAAVEGAATSITLATLTLTVTLT